LYKVKINNEPFNNKFNIIPNIKTLLDFNPYNALCLDANNSHLFIHKNDWYITKIPLNSDGSPNVDESSLEGASGFPVVVNNQGNAWQYTGVTIGERYKYVVATNRYKFEHSTDPKTTAINISDLLYLEFISNLDYTPTDINYMQMFWHNNFLDNFTKNMFSNSNSTILWLIDNYDSAFSITTSLIDSLDMNTLSKYNFTNFVGNLTRNVKMASNFDNISILLAKNGSINSPFLVSDDYTTSSLLISGLSNEDNITFVCVGSLLSWCTNKFDLFYIINDQIKSNPVWIKYTTSDKEIIQFRTNLYGLYIILNDTTNDNVAYILDSEILNPPTTTQYIPKDLKKKYKFPFSRKKSILPTLDNQCNPLGSIVDQSTCNNKTNCIYAAEYCYELNNSLIDYIDKTTIICIITRNKDGSYNLNFKSTILNKLYIIKKIDFTIKDKQNPDNTVLTATLINLDLTKSSNKNNIYVIDTNGNMFIKLKLFADYNDTLYDFTEIKLTDINNKKIILSETSNTNTIFNKSTIETNNNNLRLIPYDNSISKKVQDINKQINDKISSSIM
jgi:hypothetical protein